jgi:xanthine dehydrogenase accessory factor
MNYYEKILELKKENKSFVTVTVVQTQGSTPGKTGFKMIVDSTKNIWGTVGGGALENEAVSESHKMLASKCDNTLKEYLLTNDENIAEPNSSILPMSCSGKIWLYFNLKNHVLRAW